MESRKLPAHRPRIQTGDPASSFSPLSYVITKPPIFLSSRPFGTLTYSGCWALDAGAFSYLYISSWVLFRAIQLVFRSPPRTQCACRLFATFPLDLCPVRFIHLGSALFQVIKITGSTLNIPFSRRNPDPPGCIPPHAQANIIQPAESLAQSE